MSKIVSTDNVEKHPNELVSRYFDFDQAPEIVGGEALAGTPTVVVVGTADNVEITVPARSGTKVTCNIAGGKAQTEVEPGVWRTDYVLRATAATNSTPAHTLVMDAVLRVEAGSEFA